MASDYYQLLGLTPSADDDLIDKAYRVLARRYHPDHQADRELSPNDVLRFEQIQYAYEVLSSPALRTQYDKGLLELSPVMQGGSGLDIIQMLRLRFEQAARGGRHTINRMSSDGRIVQIDVQVPRAVEDGARLRIRGQGLPAPGGGPSGDLILIIGVEPHRQFRRDGLDLYVDVPITIDVAMLGGRVPVPTLEKETEVEIPPGTSGGTKLRIRAAGLRNNDNQYGDLYAVIRIRIPRAVSRRAQEIAAAGESPTDPAAPPAAISARAAAPARRGESPDEPTETADDLDTRAARLDRVAGRLSVRARRLQSYRAALRQRLRRLEAESASAGRQRQLLEKHAMLVMVDAEGGRRTFPLAKPVTVIGRRAACDLAIPLTSVSREHAQIEFREDKFFVRDLDSANGIQVNQARVADAELAPGDVITVGPVHLMLRFDGVDADQPPADPPLSQIPEGAEPISYSAAARAAYHEFQVYRREQDQLQEKTADLEQSRADLSTAQQHVDQQQAELDDARRRVDDDRDAVQHQLDTLAEQRAALEQRQQHLDEQTRELEQSREAAEQDRREIDRQREELTRQQQQVEARRAESDALRHQLLTEREQQDGASTDLEAARDALDRQRLELLDLRQAHDEREAGLNDREASLTQQTEQHQTREQQLDEIKQQLANQRVALEAEQAKLATQQADAETRSQQIAQQLDQLDADRRQLQDQQRQLESQQQALTADRAALAAEREQLTTDQLKAQADSAAVEQLQTELDRQQKQLHTDQLHVDRQRAQAEQDQRQIEQQQRALAERSQQLDQRAAEVDEATSQHQQQVQAAQQQIDEIERHRRELTEREAQLTQREAAIAAGEHALTESRKQIEQRTASLNQQEQRLTRQLNELPEHLRALAEQRLAAETLQHELTERKSELDATVERITKQNEQAEAEQRRLEAARAEFVQQQAAFEQQRDAIEHQQDELTRQREQHDRLAAELAEQRNRLETREAELDTLAEQLEQRTQELEQAERDLKHAKAAFEASRAEPVEVAAAIHVPREPEPADVETASPVQSEPAAPTAPVSLVRYSLERADHQPALDLSPNHIRVAAGFEDRDGQRHLFIDFIDAAAKTTNAWGAEIRHYRLRPGAKNWDWVATAVSRGSFENGEPDCYGAASPAIVHVGRRLYLFYAGRGELPPDAQPNILAPRGAERYLSSRICVAAADTDASGAPVTPFEKLGVALDLSNSWDSLRLDHPAVVLDGNHLHLFYTGYDDARSLERRKLGHAVANVNDLEFTRDAGPALAVRGGGEMPRIFHHDGLWHLLYQHYAHTDGARWRHYIGHRLPHFDLVNADLFDGVHGETNPVMLFTDPNGRLLDDHAALVSSHAGGCWRLFPYQLTQST